MKKKQLVPLVLLVLLMIASAFRYSTAEISNGKLPMKTDRWTGVTWIIHPEKEEPISNAPENAVRTRNNLTYAWLVITVGTIGWSVVLKLKKEED